MTVRGWALMAFGVLVVAGVVLAAVLIPWHRPPAPRADQLSALGEFDQSQVDKAEAFHRALRPGSYGSMLIGLVVALVLGLTPLGAGLVTLAGRPFGGHWVARALLGGLLIVLVSEVVTLPFAAWRHTIVVRYGISTQSWGPWAVDLVKGWAVGAVIGGVALLGFFAVVRLAPRWWWAWGAAGAAILVILLSFVLPVLVEPVFNKFTPMAAGPLRTDLMRLADRDGVPVKDVLVADASRRTRAVNAYVSGFGPTRRIVVYDTMLTEATPAEVVSVTAHELGHAKAQDVLIGTLLGALGTAAAVIGLYLLGFWSALLRTAGVDSIAEPRALGLLVAIAAVAGLVATPAQSFVTRQIEARADDHALELTQDPATFESMQRKLGSVNLAEPDPPAWEQVLFASHPSTVERMAAARAWARGER
ncbi:M48 family metallopeptidase [Actinoplanes sp. NPDC051470]|uniref:M48 family metallopeptidase n=1 Tax=unclassified Actinoplanes TaxID=2626549 RepID=UPI00343960D9